MPYVNLDTKIEQIAALNSTFAAMRVEFHAKQNQVSGNIIAVTYILETQARTVNKVKQKLTKYNIPYTFRSSFSFASNNRTCKITINNINRADIAARIIQLFKGTQVLFHSNDSNSCPPIFDPKKPISFANNDKKKQGIYQITIKKTTRQNQISFYDKLNHIALRNVKSLYSKRCYWLPWQSGDITAITLPQYDGAWFFTSPLNGCEMALLKQSNNSLYVAHVASDAGSPEYDWTDASFVKKFNSPDWEKNLPQQQRQYRTEALKKILGHNVFSKLKRFEPTEVKNCAIQNLQYRRKVDNECVSTIFYGENQNGTWIFYAQTLRGKTEEEVATNRRINFWSWH